MSRIEFETQAQLVNYLIQRGVLISPHIQEAFRSIDRIGFVRSDTKAQAYEDYPLPIGWNQTISQPSTVAIMLELLQPQKGSRILDIGSGSGYTTALLAYITGPSGMVLGLERIPELVIWGQSNVSAYSFPHTKIKQADTLLGTPDTLWDYILVNASSPIFPEELLDQLQPGGRILVPVKNQLIYGQKSLNGHFHKQVLDGFVFVPLIY